MAGPRVAAMPITQYLTATSLESLMFSNSSDAIPCREVVEGVVPGDDATLLRRQTRNSRGGVRL